jgi:spermidine dehydrogenase
MTFRHGMTRRDFLQGTAMTIAAGLTPAAQLNAETAPYPPALTGLRGSHAGAFEAAHALAREGKLPDLSGLAPAEDFDLIVVGGGISGLAAAFFWRKAKGPDARILILDTHDDFGGHAKRNEFTTPDGRLMIGYGGSESLEAPTANFSDAVRGLMRDLGVDLARFETAFDQGLYQGLGLQDGLFLNAEDFGKDHLSASNPLWGDGADLDPLPLSDAAKAEVAVLLSGKTDPLAGLSDDEKREYLGRTSYADYLAKAGLGDEAQRLFAKLSHDYFAIGPDALPADWAMETGYPGFAGLGLAGDGGEEEPYIYHFPDGNAGIARLLVRALVPGAIPGSTMEDIVLARADYARLDLAENPTRLRLNATALQVRTAEDAAEVAYVQGGQTRLARGASVILACYNMIIPHLMPDLPAAQKEALSHNVKAPLVYANVLIRNWQAFAALGVSSVHSPKGFWPLTMLDFPVALGGYQNPRDPAEPMVLHMVHVPTEPGLPQADQFRAGRAALLDMPFDAYEAKITDQLQRMLGAGGFDAARDILAITVNRWPHGYAGFVNPLFDPPEAEGRMEAARAPAGRVAIANSDAGWNAFAHEAIDQAHRAVRELA